MSDDAPVRCKGDNACPFPVAKGGRCRKHYLEQFEDRSMIASTLPMLWTAQAQENRGKWLQRYGGHHAAD